MERSAEDADEGHVEDVMQLALRLGEEMFVAGFETRSVQEALEAVARRYDVEHLEGDLTARSIHLQWRPPGRRPLVMMRVARTDDARDLDRMNLVHRLIERIVAGRVDVDEAIAELEAITRAQERWPWWVRMAGGAVLAAMISLQAGGTVAGAVAAALLLALVNRTGWLLGATCLPPFYITAIQAMLVVLAGAGLFQAGFSGAAVAGLMAANLVLLLPILSVVSLAEDAISGFNLMAASRLVSVVLLIGGLVAGAAIAGSVALRVGDFEQMAYGVRFAALPLVVAVLSAAVGAAGNTLFNGGAARLVPAGVAAGLLAGTVNQLLRAGLHAVPPLAVLVAATALGWAATLAARRLRIPSAVLVIPGVTGALLPGPDVYLSLVKYATGAPDAGSSLLTAIVTTAAIGVGAVLGSIIGLRRVRAEVAPSFTG
ncbi:threonine/serine ThrE exporter family protein [Actinomadura flavalba]|uniref:threonine/serine ThrE exporter family protein n=1 Tax=Actinomadura flavalba TaxID=1120938 RepID=UPI000378C221|nr:threonine/serine exporter family protein [Actinomadura flavalba]